MRTYSAWTNEDGCRLVIHTDEFGEDQWVYSGPWPLSLVSNWRAILLNLEYLGNALDELASQIKEENA